MKITSDSPQRFFLRRKKMGREDGTPRFLVVAEGVVFCDGSCVVRWLGDTPTTVLHEDIDSVENIHRHDGTTRIQWHAQDPICGTCASGNLMGDPVTTKKYQCGACSTIGHELVYDRRETDKARIARGEEPVGTWVGVVLPAREVEPSAKT